MRQITVRLSVLLVTFIIGVLATSYWVTFRHRSPQHLTVQAPDAAADNNLASNDPVLTSNVDEDYAVYAAVLADERYNHNFLVIRDHTFHSELTDATYLSEEAPELARDAISDYQAKNKEGHSLHDSFNVRGKVVFISDKEQERLFRKGHDGWTSFYKKYPDAAGIISFSGVGFNLDRTQALVNVGIGCGWLCGEGNFILLRKENGKWSVSRKLTTWVS